MFRDDAWWLERDRRLERADGASCCGQHVDRCRCASVTRLPRLRVARPMPDRAGDLLAFPTNFKAAGRGGYPDRAA
jgi:hypothetical protein